jgi:KipI family sensor histidine kinase inhibitor
MTPHPIFPDPIIREAGDSALLLQVGEPTIVPESNARAIAIARAIRQRAVPGVRDVVSTFRSVAVFFDPLSTDVASVAAVLHEAAGADLSEEPGRVVDVPVVYGGDTGPDLAEVAAFAGCTPEAVVERHAFKPYRVYMLGFLPGFPYMAHVDPTIAAPRHAQPRLRVAAGSVGIAGAQTGIYPRESPGGWQIIGRTSATLFDPTQTPPALFAPGDQVRFVPVDDRALTARTSTVREPGRVLDAGRAGPRRTSRFITVLRPGLLTTVQDSGRWGYQSLGVPVAGPMDHASHRLANVIVGNSPGAATLEATLVGPELRMEQETFVALTGADLRATVDGAAAPLYTPVHCHQDSVLRFGERRGGTRAYVAFDGGVAPEPVLGSRATHVLSGLGGIDGRALKPGDRLTLGEKTKPGLIASRAVRITPRWPGGGARLRVLPGPQADYFDRSALDALQRLHFTISPQSDRMGYRLAAPGDRLPATALIPGRVRGEMISDVTFMGGLQIPPSGDPILLMADRQTTGGYPQLAVVITADLPVAGQLGPGDWIEFELCRRTDAIAALIAAEGKILAIR